MKQTRVITSAPPSSLEFADPICMVTNLWSFRELIGQLTRREVAGRYKGTYLGLVWSVINPLMTLTVYAIVFGLIFQPRFAGVGAGKLDFVLNLFCGLIVYGIFSSTLGRSPELVIDNRNYVKRVVFPLEVLPVANLASNLVYAGMGLAILIPAVLVLAGTLSSTIYLFALVLLPLCALTLGASWILASVGVFLRDVGQAVIVMLQLLLFLSPVLYPLSAVPERFQLLARLNPFVTILEDARRTLLLGLPPDWGWWAAVTVFSFVALQLGYIWFMKSKRAFADVL
jgi:lipopolysaccharide transport system permease protein